MGFKFPLSFIRAEGFNQGGNLRPTGSVEDTPPFRALINGIKPRMQFLIRTNIPRPFRAGLLISVLFLLILLSCSSVKGVKRISGEAVMYGMVYNNESIPVSNAEVIVDKRTVALTDTQGRFLLSSKQRKDFKLSVVKQGYETVTGNFHFEPMEVIHLVMINADQLINNAEYAMDEGRYNDVLGFCNRALELNPERLDASYLKALAWVRLREYGDARKILEELQKKTGEREYIRKILETLPE
jgi:hypothetical protein